MDRRISGALAWGALAVIIGVPTLDIMSRDKSDSQALAFETGVKPWAQSGVEQDQSAATTEVADAAVSTSDAAKTPVPDYAAIPLPFRTVGDAQSVNTVASAAQGDAEKNIAIAATPLATADEEQAAQRTAVREIDLHGVPASQTQDTVSVDGTNSALSASVDGDDVASLGQDEVIPYPVPASQRPEATPQYVAYDRDEFGYERDASGSVPSRYSRFEADVRDSIENIRRSQQQPVYDEYTAYDNGGTYDDPYASTDCEFAQKVDGIVPEGGVYLDSDGDGYPDSFVPCGDTSASYDYVPADQIPSSRFANQQWQARSDGYSSGYDEYSYDEEYPATLNGGTRLDLLQ